MLLVLKMGRIDSHSHRYKTKTGSTNKKRDTPFLVQSVLIIQDSQNRADLKNDCFLHGRPVDYWTPSDVKLQQISTDWCITANKRVEQLDEYLSVVIQPTATARDHQTIASL